MFSENRPLGISRPPVTFQSAFVSSLLFSSVSKRFFLSTSDFPAVSSSLSLSLGADNGPVRLAARLKSNVCHVHRPRRLVIGARERQLHLKKSMLRWKVSYGLRNPCLFRVTSGSFDTSLGGIVFFASNLCTIINLYTTLRVEF